MLRESLPNYDASIKIEQVLKINHLDQNIKIHLLKIPTIRDNRLTMKCSSLFMNIYSINCLVNIIACFVSVQ